MLQLVCFLKSEIKTQSKGVQEKVIGRHMPKEMAEIMMAYLIFYITLIYFKELQRMKIY